MANALTQLFINAPFTVSQDTNVFGEYSNLEETQNYDYIFKINVATLCNNNMSLLFNNASFSQSLDDLENVNINIVLDDHETFTNWGNLFNNQDLTDIISSESTVAFSTLQPNTYQSIGDRLLEVVAHKLFGHGQARAAINNDDAFFTHDNEIWDNLSVAVSNNDFRHDIFNQYVALGRYGNEANSNANTNDNNQNDVNYDNGEAKWVPFNFNGLTFDFPMYLVGDMTTSDSLTDAERNLLQNGPNVGGTSLVNGAYNIPILIKFHQ